MKNNLLGINELIQRLKKELLMENEKDAPKLFYIDEVTVEVNFVVTGDIESGFDFGVVSLGSNINEQRLQKITIKMSPITSKKAVINLLEKSMDEETKKAIKDATSFILD